MELSQQEKDAYYEMSIGDLRKEIKLLNQKHEFAKSKAITEILERKTSGDEAALRSYLASLTSRVDAVFIEFNEKIEELEEEFKQRENYLRFTIDDSFKELKQKQLKALTEIEKKKELSILRESERESAKVMQMRQMAVKLADRGEFEEAMRIDGIAKEQRERETQEGVLTVQRKYEGITEKALSQFTMEIRVLEDKFFKGIDLLQRQLDHEVYTAQKQTAIAVRRVLRSAINEATKLFKRKPQCIDLPGRLTTLVTNRAIKYGMNHRLQFEAGAGDQE